MVWLTGVPGAGKSVAETLRDRGFDAHDADSDNFRMWRHIETGAFVDSPGPPDPTVEWQPHHQLVLVPDRVAALRTNAADRVVLLAGHVPNEDECLELFDIVVAIAVDDETLRRRLRDRPGRAFGKAPEVRDVILSWNRAAGAHYDAIGARVVDGTLPLDDVADAVLRALGL